MTQDQKNLKNNIFHLLCGGFAGAISRTTTAPLERLVILRQTSNKKYESKNLFQVFTHMYKTEGIFSFFKGNAVNCLRIAPFQAIEFFSYDKYKLISGYFFQNNQNIKLQYFFCGILSGMTASTFVYPMDLMRTIFAYQTDQKEYKGVINTLFKIYKEKGFLGLYKGWGVTMFGIGPYAGFKLSIFNLLQLNFNPKQDRGSHVNVLLGAISGCMAVSITYPTDLNGLRGFYLGLGVTYLKVIPSTGLAFALNERFKQILNVNVKI